MITKFVPAQTSVPDWLMTYSRQLAEVHYARKLNNMYIYMLQGFLMYEPWKANPPLKWRVAKIHRPSPTTARKSVDLGWVPMNMLIPTELYDKIKHVIEVANTDGTQLTRQLSLRTFLYTAVCWWCTSVYPYKGSGLISELSE